MAAESAAAMASTLNRLGGYRKNVTRGVGCGRVVPLWAVTNFSAALDVRKNLGRAKETDDSKVLVRWVVYARN